MKYEDIEEFQKKLEKEYRIPVSGELNIYDVKYNFILMQAIEACVRLKLYNRKNVHDWLKE